MNSNTMPTATARDLLPLPSPEWAEQDTRIIASACVSDDEEQAMPLYLERKASSPPPTLLSASDLLPPPSEWASEDALLMRAKEEEPLFRSSLPSLPSSSSSSFQAAGKVLEQWQSGNDGYHYQSCVIQDTNNSSATSGASNGFGSVSFAAASSLKADNADPTGLMELDEQIGSNLLCDEVFGGGGNEYGAVASVVGPVEDDPKTSTTKRSSPSESSLERTRNETIEWVKSKRRALEGCSQSAGRKRKEDELCSSSSTMTTTAAAASKSSDVVKSKKAKRGRPRGSSKSKTTAVMLGPSSFVPAAGNADAPTTTIDEADRLLLTLLSEGGKENNKPAAVGGPVDHRQQHWQHQLQQRQQQRHQNQKQQKQKQQLKQQKPKQLKPKDQKPTKPERKQQQPKKQQRRPKKQQQQQKRYKYQEIVAKLEESMKRSQETRKSLSVVKAANQVKTCDNGGGNSDTEEAEGEREEYGRVSNVAGVLASIEKSSRQLRTYYSRALSATTRPAGSVEFAGPSQ